MTITAETKGALLAMSAEDIATTIQVAGNDTMFMSALNQKQVDALVKASIEHASDVQEKTEKWPTFEEWLKFRSELIFLALRESADVAATTA